MTRIQDHWRRLRFNRLDFDRSYVVDQVLSQKPRSRVLLTRRHGGQQQTVMKLSDPVAANPLEVECLRSLRHPGIAGYIGHGFTRDRFRWMETEYIDGSPLSEWLDHPRATDPPINARPVKDAANIYLQLLSVVQYLHCCGWLHGDLSPQNILISPGSRGVVLIDFEHARAIDATTFDASGRLPRRHSLAFASPHEVSGGITTESCEQFALGKLGFLLLGHFENRARNAMESVLSRATSGRPEDRYPNLRGVVQDVEACIRNAGRSLGA